MRLFPLVVAFSLISVASAEAQYQINLAGEMQGDHNSGDNSNFYIFSPFISATNNGGPTTAFITLSSPDSSFQGFVNNPSNNTASSSGLATTADIVSHANGVWTLSIVDGANTYDYNVSVSVTLPFTNIPSITSSDMMSGNSFNGTIHFALAGGSATYPGAGSQFRALFVSPDFATQYANDFLPITATSWTPTVNFNGASQALAEILTVSGAVDSTSLVVNSITPVGSGEPTVTFGTPTLTYSAESGALLNVPEPASLAIFAAAGAGLLIRRRRSI